MKLKYIVLKVALLVCIFQQWGCEDTFNKHYTSERDTNDLQEILLMDALKEMPHVSEFYEAVMTAQLDTMISNRFIYTVFAPENEFFDLAKIPESEQLDYLMMHFTYGEYTTNLLENKRLEMFSLKSLNFKKVDGKIQVDNYANVISPDYRTSNGVIHTLDTTLVYKNNVYEYLNETFDFLATHFDSKIVHIMDHANSFPTGEFTENGETVYDTVWIPDNTFLTQVADLTNEQAQYTLVMPTKSVIDEALEDEVSQYFGGVDNVPSIIYTSILDGIIENSVFPNAYSYESLPENMVSVGYQPINIDKGAIIESDVELSNGILHITEAFKLDNSSFLNTKTILFKDYSNEDRDDGSLDFYIESFNGVEGDNRHWDVSDHSDDAIAPNVLFANHKGVLSWKEYFHEEDWIEFEIPDVLKTTYEVWYSANGAFYQPKYKVQFRGEDGIWEEEEFEILNKEHRNGAVAGTVSFESFGNKTIRFTSIPGGGKRSTSAGLYELRLIPVTK